MNEAPQIHREIQAIAKLIDGDPVWANLKVTK